MRFHILGIGPIGTLYAHHLRTILPKIHSVTLIHKTDKQVDIANKEGNALQVTARGSTHLSEGFTSEAFNAIPEKKEDEPVPEDEQPEQFFESLIVATKAHNTVPALRRLKFNRRISRHTTIVLLQNGAGIYEELVSKVFSDPRRRPHFILTHNTHGARFQRFGQVIHSGVGEFDFAIVPDPARRDFEAGFNDTSKPQLERKLRLQDIAFPPHDADFARYKTLRNTVAALSLLEPLAATWRPMSELQIMIRRKIVVNSIINPLTAIMGCRNGRVFETVSALNIMQRICQEAADVYAAQIRAETSDWLSELAKQGVDTEDVPVGRIPRNLTREMLEYECLRVAEMTKENISSMLSDIRRGRPTEVDYMNGYLLRLGRLHNVPMPVTATLRNLVNMRGDIAIDQLV